MLMESNNMLSLSSLFENDKLVIDKDRNAVEHKYVDHSHETSDEVLTRLHVDTRPTAKGGVTVPFPLKLHEMLDQIEEDGLAHVVSWQPHGRCFCVHKQQDFVEKIMPTYFRQTKFASFQRQLNLYGFQRLTSGRDKGGYYHELFLRGKRFLCHRIHRIKIKGTGVRKASSPETEPQFYNMPPVLLGGEQEENAKLPAVNAALHNSINQLPWNANTLSLGGTIPQLSVAALAQQQQQQQQQLALLQSLQTSSLPPAGTVTPSNSATLSTLLHQQHGNQLASLVAASSKANEWQQQLQQLQQQQLQLRATAAPPSKAPTPSIAPAPAAPASIDDDQEFGAVLKALVKMPVEPEESKENPLAKDDQLGNLFEMLTE